MDKGMKEFYEEIGEIYDYVSKISREKRKNYTPSEDWKWSKEEELEYELGEQFDGNTFPFYRMAFEWAVNHGYDTVVDIGCCNGHQALIIKHYGWSLKFVGVDMFINKLAPKGQYIGYIEKTYPCELPKFDKSKTLCISHLCVGYLMNDFEALAKDFDHFYISMPQGEALSLSNACKGSLEKVRDNTSFSAEFAIDSIKTL